MERPKLGTLSGLFSLFGWMQSTPINLTKEEAEKRRRPDLSGGSDQSEGSLRYHANSNPELRYSDMLQMSQSDMVGPILDVYAEETCQPDINKGRSLWYECDDQEVEKDLNDMLDRINAEEHMPSIIIGAAGTGNEFRRILYNENGVQQLVGVPRAGSAQIPVRRIWDKTTRRLLGFKWEGQQPRDEDAIYKTDPTIFSPWSFIHFRRINRSDTEYGEAILDKLYPIWRKLDQSIDQMVMYRRHTMPTRHAAFVDVKDQDITDAMESIHIFAHMMRQQHIMTSSGMESRYNPPALESMLFVPKRGTDDGTQLTTLAGDKDVPDIPDIEQLVKQLYGGARVPKSYMGQDDEGNSLAQSSLVSQDIRFARLIRNIRRILVAGFYRLAQIHLALTGKDPSLYNIKVKMSRISTIEEEVNVSILEKQANLSRSIADLCQQLEIPNREIIDLVFREYLSVPRYFIDIAKLGTSVARALGSNEASPGGPGGGGGLGGIGLDDGDLGDGDLGDLGDEDGGGDLGAAPQNAQPEPQVASKRKSSNLFEARRKTSKKENSVLLAAVRGISTPKMKALTAEKRDKLLRGMFAEIRSIGDLHFSKKSSLVEDYSGHSFASERLALSGEVTDKASAKARLHESHTKEISELAGMSGKTIDKMLEEALIVEAVKEDGSAEEQNEAVSLKKRMKKS